MVAIDCKTGQDLRGAKVALVGREPVCSEQSEIALRKDRIGKTIERASVEAVLVAGTRAVDGVRDEVGRLECLSQESRSLGRTGVREMRCEVEEALREDALVEQVDLVFVTPIGRYIGGDGAVGLHHPTCSVRCAQRAVQEVRVPVFRKQLREGRNGVSGDLGIDVDPTKRGREAYDEAGLVLGPPKPPDGTRHARLRGSRHPTEVVIRCVHGRAARSSYMERPSESTKSMCDARRTVGWAVGVLHGRRFRRPLAHGNGIREVIAGLGRCPAERPMAP